MLNSLGLAFKTYLTIVNKPIRKDAKLDDDETIFEVVKEDKT